MKDSDTSFILCELGVIELDIDRYNFYCKASRHTLKTDKLNGGGHNYANEK